MQQDRNAMYLKLGLIKVVHREQELEPILTAHPWIGYGKCVIVARKGWLTSGVSKQLHFFTGKVEKESGLFMRQYATGNKRRSIPSGEAVRLFSGPMTKAKIKRVLPKIREFLGEPELGIGDIDLSLAETLSIDTSPWKNKRLEIEPPDYQGELQHIEVVEKAERALIEFRQSAEYDEWRAAGYPDSFKQSIDNTPLHRKARSSPTVTVKLHPKQNRKQKQVRVAQ